MNGEIVQDHDLSRAQAGSQDLPDIRFKGGSICRAIEQLGFPHALQRQRGNQGQVRPVVTGNCANGTLSLRCIGVQRRHVDPRTGFIHDDQILGG